MVLRYSYKTELARLEAQKIGLEIDLIKNPYNLRARDKLKEIQESIKWVQKQIAEGKDPGCIIL